MSKNLKVGELKTLVQNYFGRNEFKECDFYVSVGLIKE